MKKIITINSNKVSKSIETRNLLTQKLISVGFEVSYNFHPETELIISIGGDGSFLKTIHDFDFPKVPVVGINTGHLGFFADISPDEIDKFISAYKNNNFLISNIPLLNAKILSNNNSTDILAINEVVIKGNKSRVIHLNLKVNNKKIQNFGGDGLILSTPTGSTAYNYSAHGSIVDPSINLMQLTPLHPINTNAYRCFTSSIIFSSNSIIDIYPEYRFEDSILIVVDGIEYKYSSVSHIRIFLSDINIKLLRMSDYEFWSRVTEKFL